MKKGGTGFSILLLGLFLAIVAAGAAFGRNLLKNPGGELSVAGSPSAWYPVGLLPGVEFRRDAEVKLSGEASLCILSKEPPPSGTSSVPAWSQEVAERLPRGRKLRLSAFVRTREVSGFAAVSFQGWDDELHRMVFSVSTEKTRPLRGSGEWTDVSASFTLPLPVDRIRVLCRLGGVGEAWFDEVTLEEEK